MTPREKDISDTQSQDQLDEDCDLSFVMEIMRRLDLKDLYQETDPETADRMFSHMERFFGDLRYKFLSKTSPTPGEANVFKDGLNKKFKFLLGIGDIVEIFFLLEKFRILTSRERVHINDICGQEGIVLGLVSEIRKRIGQTSGVCIDIDNRMRGFFEMMQRMFDMDQKLITFEEGDVAEASISNKPGAKNYWILIKPDSEIKTMMQRLARLEGSELPDGVVMMPCVCHGFKQDQYPSFKSGKEILSIEEWERLVTITEMGIPESRLAMNCIRAQWLNDSNPSVKARVHKSLRGQNSAILVQKSF